MNKLQIVILAAGKGKRMNSQELPKVLVPLRGKPMIKYLLESIKQAGISNPVIVVGQQAERVKAELGGQYQYVFQAEQLGTGHAVAVTRDTLLNQADHIMVLYGDHPHVSAATIKSIADAHLSSNNILTMATVKVDDFFDWRQSFYDFGRIVRDVNGDLDKIVEKRDATPEQLEIKEVNPSYFCFRADWLWENLVKLKNENSQGEYYLTDLLGLAVDQNQKITTVEIEPLEALGVNTQEQLQQLENL
ncbi:MAG: NTP transferase domain-containing protein [Candidatus Buchananbacteria bacterium]|nr:NTP transferase domain-containing protein [Candidatus Buchananbacteria bacterium]